MGDMEGKPIRSAYVPRWAKRVLFGGAVLLAALLMAAPPGQAQEGTPTTGIILSATPSALSEGASSVTFAITARWASGTADITNRVINYTIAFPSGVTTSPTTLTGSVTIATGSLSGSANHAALSLSGLENTVIESSTRNVTISGSVSGEPSISVHSATIPITDNDNAVTLTLASGGSALTEVDEGSSTQITVTASLPTGTTAPTSNTDLTITVGGVSGDTAVAGTDFTSVTPFALRIPANSLSGTATFTLASTADTIPVGGSKRLSVSGSTSGFVFTPARLTINDLSSVTLTLSSGGSALSSVAEGSSIQVTVTASLPAGSTAPASNVDLTISVGGGMGDTATAPADFATVADFTLRIPASSLTGTANFTLTTVANTVPVGGSKTLTVSGSAAGFTVTGARLTINDQTTITLSLSSGGSALSSVVEGSSTQVTVTASLPAGATASTSNTDMTITVGGAGGDTAAAGTDFTAVSPFALRIPANSVSGTADFTFASLADTIPAGGSKRLTVSSSTAGYDIVGARLTITAAPEPPAPPPAEPPAPSQPTGPTAPPPSSGRPSSPELLTDRTPDRPLADFIPDWSACLGPARRATLFTDVADWDADPAIRCATYYRITVGRTPTLFSPTENVPRWQMALFMFRAAGPAGVDLSEEADQGFTDIGGLSEEARRAANAVAQSGIMPGTEEGRFDPQGLVSRRSMALILHSFLTRARLQAGTDLEGAAAGFTDLDGLTAAERRAVGSLSALGVVRGADANRFAPDDPVTRVQMMRLIARALAYTAARPAGTSMQADRDTAEGRAVDLLISVRDENFLPVPGAPVDIFFARESGDAFSDNGRCLTGLLMALAGSQVCLTDGADPVTGPGGDLRIRATELVPGQRIWAWSGTAGTRVSDLVRFARLQFVF